MWSLTCGVVAANNPPRARVRTQSTFCHQIQEHCASIGRSVHVINLDPAADSFGYAVSADIRELVDVEARRERAPLPRDTHMRASAHA